MNAHATRIGFYDNLTLSCPPFITACVGIYVLAHAVESYTAIPFAYLPVFPEEEDAVVYHGAFPITDGNARDAIALVAANLRIAVDQGRNLWKRAPTWHWPIFWPAWHSRMRVQQRSMQWPFRSAL